jgi:cobaltochelatase CobN
MTGNEVAHLIEDLDGYLCELGMAQIRDGLHILGQMPPLPEMLRSLTRLANVGAPSLQLSLATAFGFDLAMLLDKPGERLTPSRELFGHTCYTHADVLELLDREALDIFTMLETLGFRIEAIAEVQRAVLGFFSHVPNSCQISNKRETKLGIFWTLLKASTFQPGQLVLRLVVWLTFCQRVETSML